MRVIKLTLKVLFFGLCVALSGYLLGATQQIMGVYHLQDLELAFSAWWTVLTEAKSHEDFSLAFAIFVLLGMDVMLVGTTLALGWHMFLRRKAGPST